MPSIETVEDLPVLDQDVAGQDAAGLGGVGQAGQDNTPATEVPLKLLTADGEEFVVEEDIMVRSRHIAKQVEGFRATSQSHPILIPYPSTVVAFIVDYCTHYRGEYLQADDPEAPRIPKRDPDDEGPSIVRVWDEEFLNVDRSTLYAILTAAHFLEVRSLVDSGTRIIANSIRGKTTEEMREILGIENDFSPEEEAANRAEAEEANKAIEAAKAEKDEENLPLQRYQAENTFLTREQRLALESMLYDKSDSFVKGGFLDTDLGVWSLTSSPYNSITNFIHRLDVLVRFLADAPVKTISVFIDFAKRELPDGAWPVDPKKDFDAAWHTVFLALHFPSWVRQRPETITDLRAALFVPNKNARCTPSIKWTLEDLVRSNITVRKTTFLHEHLQLVFEGSNVVVLVFAPRDRWEASSLMKYEHSKVAKVLGLQSLGMETLASLRWIIGKDPQYKLAREYGLLPRNDDSNFMITIAAISCYEGKQDQLHMLSYRIAAISDLIRWRRRWWKVLAADMRRQSEAQPVLFYGTLLAVFFGVMSVVQTVTAVWALVLAIQQAGGGNSS